MPLNYKMKHIGLALTGMYARHLSALPSEPHNFLIGQATSSTARGNNETCLPLTHRHGSIPVRGDCVEHSAGRKIGQEARRALTDDCLPKLSAATTW
jgi:hypothetical protein